MPHARLSTSLLLAGLLATAALRAQTPPPPPDAHQDAVRQAFEALEPRYQQWVLSVRGLMTQAELDFFLGLGEDFRRDAFMEAFWGPRDPDPTTPQNELRERWDEYQRRSQGIPWDDPRFVAYLLNGPPTGQTLWDGRPLTRCWSRSQEYEIWFYSGSHQVDEKFILIFQRISSSKPYEIYRLGSGWRPIQRTSGLPVTDISLLCSSDVERYAISEIRRDARYDSIVEKAMSPPLPSPEWLATFSASSTELPAGAETFAAEVDVRYPARNQSRTAVQVMLGVALAEAPGKTFDGELFYDFHLTGEVLREGKLFEKFDYRFEGPTPAGATEIPLGFTRDLRPGPVEVRLLLEDVYGGRFARRVLELDVPSPEGLPSVPPSALETAAGGKPSLRLITPPGTTLAGLVRFHTRAEGALDKVTFFLDDRPVLSKRTPPYSVEIDLGAAPEPHRVRVVAYQGEQEVATDQIWLNQGAQRFRVHLVEPRAGGIYPGSLTARVEVQTPDGLPPERVELFVDERPVATLREPPYVQTLRLGGEVAVIKAVAFMADGTSGEDAVVVNTAFTETVEVRLVELSVLVTDEEGGSVAGLGRDAFRVLEDGVPQTIRRFEATAEAPIRAALMIDRSSSMAPHLAEVTAAAESFAASALRTADDRVAVFSFADRLSVDADFGAGKGPVERALAGVEAGGRTALYDSLVEALQTFAGLGGQTALVLFTDGQDELSRMTFEQALETARRAGVVVYPVGPADAFPDRGSRRPLEELAAETGGRATFPDRLDDLAGVYGAILAELRARYLLAYQSSSAKPANEYRSVTVEVEGSKKAVVRTRRGYIP